MQAKNYSGIIAAQLYVRLCLKTKLKTLFKTLDFLSNLHVI